MGEKAKKIGEKLEGFGERLYDRFGWNELTRDQEIKCTKSSHKKKQGTRTHGVDLYHKYYDPYRAKNVGVITECKNYAWNSIIPSKLQEWFDQLLGTKECAQISENLIEYNQQCDTNNTGILLVHANDGKYNETKFREYLSKLNYKSKRNTINIFVAGNREIERWDSMFEYIEKEFKNDDFKFYYPSIMGSQLTKKDYVTIDQLFSTFIFGENIKVEEFNQGGRRGTCEITQSIVFSFDKISENAFCYLCNMFKELQLERADEYIFCFYPETKEDSEFIDENFLKYANTQFDGKKVYAIKLDNRTLSPVDTK